VIVIRHQNPDAMVLAGALLGGIHPPDNIQNDGRQGGMPLGRALAGTWQRLLESTFCVSLFCARGVTASVYGTCRVTNHDEEHLTQKTMEMGFCIVP
jgi:hypothetical protein